MNLAKRGPVSHLPIPTLPHQVIEFARALSRAAQVGLLVVISEEVSTVLNHLLIVYVVKGMFPGQGEDFP